MAKLRIKAPDGKTLVVQVPEGTDASQYDALATAAISDYTQKNVQAAQDPESDAYERPGGGYPSSMYTEANPTADLYASVEGVRALPAVIKAVPAVVKAVPKLAGAAMDGAGAMVDAVKGGVGKVAGAVGEQVGKAVDTIKGETPRAFGFAQGAGQTPEARQLAKDSIDFATNAQPDVAKLAGDAGAEGAESLNSPIKSGFFGGDPEAMLQTVKTQKDAVGKAIENTLGKYDGLDNSYYNPEKLNEQVKAMFHRDMNGNIMTTGWQGEANEAMKKALSSLTDYAQGQPVKWSTAAQIKSGLQGDASFGEAGKSGAQAAYDKVASLLRDDIDQQAAEMLSRHGNPADVQQYQQLREAYGKLAGLNDSLNVAAKRRFANTSIPWWIKSGATAALGTIGAGALMKGLTH